MARKPTFYDTPAWQKARLRQLARYPFCEFEGCKERAQHVDHVMTVRAAPHRRLDEKNLQSLCEKHHNQITNAYDRGSVAGACDEHGYPLDPNHPWNQTSNFAAIESVNVIKKASPQLTAKLKRGLMKKR